MPPTFDLIKNIQKSQNFNLFDKKKANEIDFDDLIALPNQFMYKVNCENADITNIKGDSKRIFGFEGINKIDHIYNLIKPSQVESFIKDTAYNLSFVRKDPKRVIPKRNLFSNIVEIKVKHGYELFLRQTFALRSDQNGILCDTAGIYTALPSTFNLKTSFSNIYGEDAVFYKNEHLQPFEKLISSRELEIMKLISEGYSTSKISKKLFISAYTVDTHRKNIIHKLDALNTPHLVAIAKDIGLI